MSCDLGIAIIVLLSALQSFLNANGVPYALEAAMNRGWAETKLGAAQDLFESLSRLITS